MSASMKAATYERYGDADVVNLSDVERPEPGEHEVLIAVHASSVTTADWRLRASAFPGILWLPGRMMTGLFRPRKPVLGAEVAGEIVAVGSAVRRFGVGDRVFGFIGSGAHAEFAVAIEGAALAIIPDGLSYGEAAALPFGALCALVFFRDFASLRPDEQILIVGATGGVGTYAVQVATAMGARVTAVTSAENADLARELGADHVIDYSDQGIARDGGSYDVVFDTVGATGFAQMRGKLRKGGRFVPLNFGLRELLQALWTRAVSDKRIVIGVNGDTAEDLREVSEMVASGQLRPVIDRAYSLEDIREAYRHVEGRHRKGSVILCVRDDALDKPSAA